MIDSKALRKLSYGVYLVTALDQEGKKVGCIANSAIQVTSNPSQLLVSLNHDNYTNKAIKETGKLSLSILGENANMDIIRVFGYSSSKDHDKFEGFELEEDVSLPVVKGTVASFVLEVTKTFETETHTLFLGEVKEAVVRSEDEVMTYSYFHKVKKGNAPKNAPTYQEVVPVKEEKSNLHHFRCMLCGYVYETEKEELPEDFTCPLCGAPRDMFEKID